MPPKIGPVKGKLKGYVETRFRVQEIPARFYWLEGWQEGVWGGMWLDACGWKGGVAGVAGRCAWSMAAAGM